MLIKGVGHSVLCSCVEGERSAWGRGISAWGRSNVRTLVFVLNVIIASIFSEVMEQNFDAPKVDIIMYSYVFSRGALKFELGLGSSEMVQNVSECYLFFALLVD